MSSTPNSHLSTTCTNTPQPIAAEVIHHQTERLIPGLPSMNSDQSESSYSWSASKERRNPSSRARAFKASLLPTPSTLNSPPADQSPLLLNPSDRGRIVRRLVHSRKMLPASRSAAAMALRVKPSMAIAPFRTTAAAFSTNSRRDASALQTHSVSSGLAKVRKEVPLPSEEGTKSVIQYALYVTCPFTTLECLDNRLLRAQLRGPNP